MTKTRSEKKQATREKILKAAYELFDEKGYDETSYTEIAERAGVGYGTIYTHFSSKENLLLEHYLELIHLQAAQLQAFSDAEANSLQRGLDMIDTVWEQNLTSPIRRLTVFFSYRWVSSKEDYDRVLDALNAVLKPIGETFKQAKDEGLLAKTITTPLVLELIRAAYLHALQDARFGNDERKAAKKAFDGQVDYLLQMNRTTSD